jgi:hypothetical protein
MAYNDMLKSDIVKNGQYVYMFKEGNHNMETS